MPDVIGAGDESASLGRQEAFEIGAGDEIRTRDQELGKLLLYQLSYARLWRESLVFPVRYKRLKAPSQRFRHFITRPSSKGRNGCR